MDAGHSRTTNVHYIPDPLVKIDIGEMHVSAVDCARYRGPADIGKEGFPGLSSKVVLTP